MTDASKGMRTAGQYASGCDNFSLNVTAGELVITAGELVITSGELEVCFTHRGAPV